MANFSATEGRVFKQYATKGRVLNQMCARKGMVFPVVVPGRVYNVKNCAISTEFSALRANTCASYPLFNNSCASKGMDLGPNFVPVRVGYRRFCASEGMGFAVPS